MRRRVRPYMLHYYIRVASRFTLAIWNFHIICSECGRVRGRGIAWARVYKCENITSARYFLFCLGFALPFHNLNSSTLPNSIVCLGFYALHILFFLRWSPLSSFGWWWVACECGKWNICEKSTHVCSFIYVPLAFIPSTFHISIKWKAIGDMLLYRFFFCLAPTKTSFLFFIFSILFCVWYAFTVEIVQNDDEWITYVCGGCGYVWKTLNPLYDFFSTS